jgi:3-phosphoshikimate 1-carboxyvinyltransferase
MVTQALAACTPRVNQEAHRIKLPPSKSMANRAMLLAALAQGDTVITPIPQGDDCCATIEALRCLGVLLRPDGDTLLIQGCKGIFPNKQAKIHVGNAGTLARPLVALLAGQPCGTYDIDADRRMKERPMKDLFIALEHMNAHIEYLESPYHLPVRIHARPLDTHHIKISTEYSSQFLSALLMACGAYGGGHIECIGKMTSEPYVQLTCRMMQQFGVLIDQEDHQYTIPDQSYYQAVADYRLEVDLSNATYFAAGAFLSGHGVLLEHLFLEHTHMQGDWVFFEWLKAQGAEITFNELGCSVCRHPKARWPISAFTIDATHIPDAAMTLAMMALAADGPCTLTGLKSWRLKECDRLAAMCRELQRIGAMVNEGEDFLCIQPNAHYQPNLTINTYNDHRMAMSFALISSLGYDVIIHDPECTHKTFPSFFSQWLLFTKS